MYASEKRKHRIIVLFVRVPKNSNALAFCSQNILYETKKKKNELRVTTAIGVYTFRRIRRARKTGTFFSIQVRHMKFWRAIYRVKLGAF